jgi:glycerate kinase
VGEIILAAVALGAKTVFVGLGGSATNDAGAGMAAALSWRFLGADGGEVDPIPANFPKIARILPPATPLEVNVRGLCDVRNPLLGPEGATRVYGPQKGATPEIADQLERALGHIADICARDLEQDFRTVPGSGAAGGLGFGLLTFGEAEIVSGFDAVDDLLGLQTQIAAADLVLTGEGRIDSQSLQGKGPAEIARLAREHGKPVIAFAGASEVADGVFDAVIPIADGPLTLDESRRRAADLLQQAAVRTARLLKIAL